VHLSDCFEHDAAELPDPSTPNPLAKPLHKMYTRALKSPEPSVQSTAALALSKLLLTGTLHPSSSSSSSDASPEADDLLRLLTLSYFDPDTRPNAALRQTLAYFLPVYSHSRRAHAARTARVAPAVLHALAERADELDEGEEMVGLAVVAGMVGGWTDPRRGVWAAAEAGDGGSGGEADEADGEGDAHFVLAGLLVERVAAAGPSREEKKACLALLGKLHLVAPARPVAAWVAALRGLRERVDGAAVVKAAPDAAARNALAKLRTALDKMVAACGDAGVDECGAPAVVASVERREEQEEDVTGLDLTMPDGEGTVLGEEDEDADDGDTVMGDGEARREQSNVAGDSLVESLLDDDDDEGEIL